jgi:hypothetical protein
LPGSQVKVDGRAVGETDSNGALRTEVAPGRHVIELSKSGFASARFDTEFTPGSTTRPERSQLAMPATARAPDPKQLESQDWERIAKTDSVDQLEDFIRKHPGGAHVEEARAREAQIRQRAQANGAILAEQTAWNATDKTKKSALQDFLSRYGDGAHAQEAGALIAGIDKQEADARAAAQQRAREQNAKVAADRALVDEQGIDRTLAAFEAAYNRKDLRGLAGIWSSMPRGTSEKTAEQFRLAKTLVYQLQPSGKPVLTGDTASVDCTRILNLTTRDGLRPPPVSERVRVNLSRAPSGWLIQSIEAAH